MTLKKVSLEHSKVSKLGLLWDPFIQSRKCMSLKFTDELCVMTINNDAKFEGKLSCAFKNDMRNLANFHRLKNNDCTLESKIAELNQNKNSKQAYRPDAV